VRSKIEFKKDSRVAEYREYLIAWFLFSHFLMSFKKSLTIIKTMNRQSLKILILLIAISFIIQIALPGYAFAYEASEMTEQRSEDHNLSGNYEGYYGGDYYNATMYNPADFKAAKYYDYDSGDSGGDQAGSDYYDWGDYDNGWGADDGLPWTDFEEIMYYDDPWGDPWVDSYWEGGQSVDADASTYNWGDYDSLSPVEDGIFRGETGAVTVGLAPDVFSPRIDDKSEIIMGLARGDADIESLGDWQKSLKAAEDLIPEIDTGLRGIGEVESAQEFLNNLGLQYE